MKFKFLISFLFLFSAITRAQTFTDSNLPIVIINTDIDPNSGLPSEIKDEPKVLANMKIIFRPDGSRNYLTDQTDTNFLNYNGRIGIETRGSSSSLLPKKAYGLTTLKSDNISNNNVRILGMPSENDWILNSIAYDAALIRNFLSYDLARSLGGYAPRCVYCEVILNGNYIGLYILMEKIKIDQDRVNILKMTNSDNNAPNVTGGYIVKADKTTGGDPVAWSMQSYSGYTAYLFDNPDPWNITSQQNNYISSLFTSLQTAATAQNATITNGYPSIIDVPSFIDYMLISEITSNADSYQFSTFFHKDRNGKLRAGPIWDYDLTYGNDLFFWNLDRSHTNIWQFDNGDNTGSKFWKDLYSNATYKCYLSKRWKELTASNKPLNYNTISTKIDLIVNLIAEAAIRENNKWATVGNQASQIVNMKTWLQARITWMNGNLSNSQTCSNPAVPPLVITKINYNPADNQGLLSNDLEFIEITNKGSQSVNLTGIYFSELGVSYQFPVNSSVAGYGKIELASNSVAFQQIYGLSAFGQFARNLSNNWQKLVLADAFGNVIDSVTFNDKAPWYPEADGKGSYLELIDINSDNSLPASWRISSNLALGINDLETENSVTIFPNPSSSKIKIENYLLMIKSFEIYDLAGKKVISGNDVNSNSFTIDIENLHPNTYILKLLYKNGTSSARMLTKQ